MKKLIVVMLISTLSLLIVSGCGTVAGVGKDIQDVGGAITDKANKKKAKSE